MRRHHLTAPPPRPAYITTTSTSPDARARWLALPGLAAFLGSAALLIWYWRDGLPYDATSGVWLALADDWAHGVLYRPLHDANGFGGTRYMPLFFMLHGWLIRAGMPMVTAGILLTITSLLLLLTAVFSVLRRLGVNSLPAASAAALLLCSISVQLLGIAVKGDLLAAALNVWGVFFALPVISRREQPATVSIAAAVFCWTMAFAIKITAVFGAIAIVMWLLYAGRHRVAAAIATSCIVLGGAVLLAANWLSQGRMAASFAAVADGGTGIDYMLRAPWWLLRAAAQDPFFILLTAAAALLAWRGRGIGALWFGLTVTGTLAIFATPGTDTNHFVDLLAVSVIIVGLNASDVDALRPDARRTWLYPASCAALALMIAVTWLPGVPSVRHFFDANGRPTWSDIAAMRSALGERTPHPLLAENPAVPLLLGQRPEVLDPFSLRLLAARDTAIARDFKARIERGHYSTVVLIDWSGADAASVRASIDAHGAAGVDQFYGGMNFPTGFLDLLWRRYDVQSVHHPFVLLTLQ